MHARTRAARRHVHIHPANNTHAHPRKAIPLNILERMKERAPASMVQASIQIHHGRQCPFTSRQISHCFPISIPIQGYAQRLSGRVLATANIVRHVITEFPASNVQIRPPRARFPLRATYAAALPDPATA